MAEIVNLTRFRKQKSRAAARAQADANAARHGRSKAEREASEAESLRAARRHEDHRRDGRPSEPAADRTADAPDPLGKGA